MRPSGRSRSSWRSSWSTWQGHGRDRRQGAAERRAERGGDCADDHQADRRGAEGSWASTGSRRASRSGWRSTGATTQEPKNAAAILRRGGSSERGRVLELESDGCGERVGEAGVRDLLGKPCIRSCHINELTTIIHGRSCSGCCAIRDTSGIRCARSRRRKEPARFLQYYRALWEAMYGTDALEF